MNKSCDSTKTVPNSGTPVDWVSIVLAVVQLLGQCLVIVQLLLLILWQKGHQEKSSVTDNRVSWITDTLTANQSNGPPLTRNIIKDIDADF